MTTKAPDIIQPQLPSADLIQYRFDKLDETLSKINSRFDEMSKTYVPREEINLMSQRRTEELASTRKELTSLVEVAREEARMANATIVRTIDEEIADKKKKNLVVYTSLVSALFISIGSLIVAFILFTTHIKG